MHTKGQASYELKKKIGIDSCIYLGNDLNDITMFSNALDDNDFIVIAKHETPEITDMIVNYLKEECKIKGIRWNDARLVVLEDENVNNFLNKTSKILAVLTSQRSKQDKDIRKKYRTNVKQLNSNANQTKKNMNRRRKKDKDKSYR